MADCSPGLAILPHKYSETADSTGQRQLEMIEWTSISTSWGTLLCTGLGSSMTRILDWVERTFELHAGPGGEI
jgi:hypothetical protein